MDWHRWRPTRRLELAQSGRRVLLIWLLTLAEVGVAYWAVFDLYRSSMPLVYGVGVTVGWILSGWGAGLLAVPLGAIQMWTKRTPRAFIAGIAICLGTMSRAVPVFSILVSLHLRLDGQQIVIIGIGVLMGLFFQLSMFALLSTSYDAILSGGVWVWNRYIVRGAAFSESVR